MSNNSFHRKVWRGMKLMGAIYAMDDFGFLFEVRSKRFKLVMQDAKDCL